MTHADLVQVRVEERLKEAEIFVILSAPVPEGHALIIGPTGKAKLCQPTDDTHYYIALEDGEVMFHELRKP